MPEYTPEQVMQHAKLCLACRRWVFKSQPICPQCGKNHFTDDLDYYYNQIKRNNTKKTAAGVASAAAGLAVAFLFNSPNAGKLLGNIGQNLLVTAERERVKNYEQFKAELESLHYRMQYTEWEQKQIALERAATGVIQLVHLGNWAEAKKYLEEALQLGMNEFEIPAGLGIIAMREGHFEKARNFLEYAYGIIPNKFIVCLLVEIYKKTGVITGEGVTHLAQSHYPQIADNSFLLWLASHLLVLGDYLSAQQIFVALLNSCTCQPVPEDVQYEYWMGYFVTVALLEQPAPAMLHEWFARHAGQPFVTKLVARIFRQRGENSGRCIPCYEAFFEEDNTDSFIFEVLFDHYLAEQEFEKAYALSENAGDFLKNDPRLSYKLALLMMHFEFYDAAIARLQALRKVPNWENAVPSDKIYLALSRGFVKRGLLDLGREIILKISDQDVRHKKLYEIGHAAMADCQYDVALNCFTAVYREDAVYEKVSEMIDQVRQLQKQGRA